jgi:hypothetical protein
MILEVNIVLFQEITDFFNSINNSLNLQPFILYKN